MTKLMEMEMPLDGEAKYKARLAELTAQVAETKIQPMTPPFQIPEFCIPDLIKNDSQDHLAIITADPEKYGVGQLGTLTQEQTLARMKLWGTDKDISIISEALVPSLAPEGNPVEVQDVINMTLSDTTVEIKQPRGEVPGVIQCDEFGTPIGTMGSPEEPKEKNKIQVLGGGPNSNAVAIELAKSLQDSGFPVEVKQPNTVIHDVAELQAQIQAMEKMLKQNGISKKQLFKKFGASIPKIKTPADEEALKAAQDKRDKRAAKRAGQIL